MILNDGVYTKKDRYDIGEIIYFKQSANMYFLMKLEYILISSWGQNKA